MSETQCLSERDIRIARVLRSLGTAPMTRQQAERAGRLLGLHSSTVYKLRRRFLRHPVTSAVAPMSRGPKMGNKRLDPSSEQVIQEVLKEWLPRQRRLAHPLLDLTLEVRRRCLLAGLKPPGRNTVARRWAEYREAQAAALADAPSAAVAPGTFSAAAPLDIVQIDHTQADVIVVDDWFRRPLGRPWLSVAIDLATRCVMGIYLSMERPNAATVALLLSRVALPKAAWLDSLELEPQEQEVSWPMHGLPKALHLDNAAEFHGRALRMGCAQYGVELMYRPVGRPQFGGHVERMNRTLMERLRGLPGATGNSPKGRKARRPEQEAVLTLAEFERWLAVEVAQRYHHSEHRGLAGATPASAWQAMAQVRPPRQLPPGPEEAMQFLVQFMPMAQRIVQSYGLSLFNIRYWHPIFAAWRELRRKVVVRYHPEDLSRVFVSSGGRRYIEVGYADVRRPRISLWEQRAACRHLRAEGQRQLSEALIFKAIEQQRRIVDSARQATRVAQRQVSRKEAVPLGPWSPTPAPPAAELDYSQTPDPFPVEIWDSPWPKTA